MFSTLMFERHKTKVAIFGGKPNEHVEYKGACVSATLRYLRQPCFFLGMAGNQVLEWCEGLGRTAPRRLNGTARFDIDSEIKTANLKDVSQPPPRPE